MLKDDIIKEITDDNTEEHIREMIEERMYEYVDEDDIEEFGGLYEAYEELGRGEAESSVLTDLLAPFNDHITTEIYLQVWEELCEIWYISTD